MDPATARSGGVTRPQRSTCAGGAGGSVCVYSCVDGSMHVCAYPPVNDWTLTCRCVCGCVRTGRGVSTARDLQSHATFQHLAADCRAAANKWARSAGRPPPNPLRERLSFWTPA